MYYLQSRYYNPKVGRFINADALVSTGQNVLGFNMFVYCQSNPVLYADPYGYRPDYHHSFACMSGGGGYGPNMDYLMAFYGVDSPSEVPNMPDGAMIFVENITTISIGAFTMIEGRTMIFDENKYCEYVFTGIGCGVSVSLPLDKTVTQGYIYGVDDVSDYCGVFFGLSFCCAASAQGGAFAFGGVYGEILSGASTSVSFGISRTYYATPQSGWIYGRANLSIITIPAHQYLPYSLPDGPVTV